ncbi:MAG: hypothetical protein U0667_14965 [Chloroflexota bacterium]
MQVATEDATRAHNEYMALPQETDAWRTGLGTRGAMLQELKAQQQVRSLFDARTKAATELQRARQAVARAEGAGHGRRVGPSPRGGRTAPTRTSGAPRRGAPRAAGAPGRDLGRDPPGTRAGGTRARIRARRAAGGAT